MSEETVVFKVGNDLAVRLVGTCRLPRGTRVRERWKGSAIVTEALDQVYGDGTRATDDRVERAVLEDLPEDEW